MSSRINIQFSSKRKPTKKQIETREFLLCFTKKYKRQPSLKELADHFSISIPSAWERVIRNKKNLNACPYCGKDLED